MNIFINIFEFQIYNSLLNIIYISEKRNSKIDIYIEKVLKFESLK